MTKRRPKKNRDVVTFTEVVEERGFQGTAEAKHDDAEWVRGFENQEKVIVKVERRPKYGGGASSPAGSGSASASASPSGAMAGKPREWVKPLRKFRWVGLFSIFLWVASTQLVTDTTLCSSPLINHPLLTADYGFGMTTVEQFKELIENNTEGTSPAKDPQETEEKNDETADTCKWSIKPEGFLTGYAVYISGWVVLGVGLGMMLVEASRFMGFFTPFVLLGVGLIGGCVVATLFAFYLVSGSFSDPEIFYRKHYLAVSFLRQSSLSIALLFLAQVAVHPPTPSATLQKISYSLSLPAPLLLVGLVCPLAYLPPLFLAAHAIVALSVYPLCTVLEVEVKEHVSREDMAARMFSPKD
eukprot:TRINITY_DN2511_c2_g1_i1.p1 TRINITY_DN2511_c2_g1~~TRINITY_DN2511_c2_g1_i1.p1  ORF type:complete len:370 (+),score=46.00 TRINITY_DN2511_c2_g1_i1:45-1112(+)